MTQEHHNADRRQPLGLVILGASGSIGSSTLDVVARHSQRYRVHALTAHTSTQRLLALCEQHRPRHAVLSGVAEDAALRRRFAGAGCELRFGPAALAEIAAAADCDTVMAAIVGAAGLPATLAAARAGKRVLLANKEALVMAGPLFMRAAREAGSALLPIDSEHNAVFQCLPQDGAGLSLQGVRRIQLTASGGPFRATPVERLAGVTPDEACAHPNWVMGRKISVDSATMMNKGLEVIEAHWLFGLPADRIGVLIHPQSIVHSLVEYLDGSVIAQLSNPDMRVPIAHALGHPGRIESGARSLDLDAIGKLTFEQPDAARFPCLGLAYGALRAGGTGPAILNAANEIAVEAFLGGRLRFTGIAPAIEETLGRVAASAAASLEHVMDADARARRAATECVLRLMGRAA
ncbi:MAG: 1-deoxy-D-xylulose-5-phosphate reductoisomerase [Betaproteobacteria bacterium]|nr:1-deoxy-D-xylulose-5-phosphate reductoisomerase [Betaproteobacteria bacterium]MDH5577165.1 1-deoxy-D-xylulose-5-phosphate reductoisomerase [Betaproteobacteria bacterium]